jgi:hypothetical protein
MPGQLWAFAFCSLLGVGLLVGLTPGMAKTAARIKGMARLPRAQSGGARASGAIFSGVLDGPATTTALGHEAIAWIGVATVTYRTRRNSPTVEKCRLGVVGGLALRPDGVDGLTPIATLPIERLDYEGRVAPFRQGPTPTLYQLGATDRRSPIPAAVAQRCRLDPADLQKDSWAYEERWAAPGTHVEMAGCLAGDAIAPCAEGDVARGDLTADGVQATARRYADRLIWIAAGLSLMISFFTVVGVSGAVLTLRLENGRGRT